MASKTRLFKIASEINIGKETIVEFLQKKGFDVHNKPTTVLTEEMTDAVYDKFKKEKKAAETQREKVQKQKETRKPAEKPQSENQSEKVQEIKKPISERINELLEAVAPKKQEVAEVIEEPKKVSSYKDVSQKETKSKETNKKESTSKSEKTSETSLPEDKDSESKPKFNKGKDELDFTQQEPGDTPKLKGLNVLGKIEVGGVRPGRDDKRKRERNRKDKPKDTKSQGQQQGNRDSKPGQQKDRPWNKDGKPGEKREFQKDRPFNKDKKDNLVGRSENREKFVAKDSGDARGGRDFRGKRGDGQRPGFGSREGAQRAGNQRPGPSGGGDREAQENRKEPVLILRTELEAMSQSPEDKQHHLKKRKKNTSYVNIDEEVKRTDSPAERGKKKRKKSIREQLKDEDINKAIKATLAGMEDSSAASARQKARQKKKIEREIKQQIIQEEKEKTSKVLKLTEFVTTSDIAIIMDVSPSEIIKKCLQLGLMVTINQRLDKDTITLIVDDYGYDVDFQDQKEFTKLEDTEDPEDSLKPRAPIVTIMGHVDHGKTSLLDHIRNTKVVAGESGGITQHIGAYHVELKDDKFITFLDTPGHEAFTAMRARGAQITDIVVLVVAADDNVMPQTKEAISHAQAAGVPIIVAINKIDKPDANPERIKQQLSELNVLVEEWGGKYQSIEISAKQGINIDELLDKIILESELLDLKANPDRMARGNVIEANLDKGLGAVATVIVRKGTLKVGDIFVAGVAFGRIRLMLDERGNKIDKVIPSMPIRIVGFDGVPSAGDNFVVLENETQAKKVATERAQLKREQELNQMRRITLNNFSENIAGGEVQHLNLILKADVNGSVEALSDELQKLSHQEVAVNILMKGVGQINESDVQLAVASNAIIITFHTNATAKAKQLANNEGVEIRDYEIIYEVIDDIKDALEGMLKPEVSEQVGGEAEIRNIFKLGRTQRIAGCKILSGKITRNAKARLLRDGLPIYEGKIGSLKREKDDVKEVSEGYECGIMLDGFNDYMEDDIIQTFNLVETKRKF